MSSNILICHADFKVMSNKKEKGSRLIECRDFKKGNCKFGSSCRFLHNNNESKEFLGAPVLVPVAVTQKKASLLSDKSGVARPPSLEHTKAKTTLTDKCGHYQRGNGKTASEYRYQHTQQGDRSTAAAAAMASTEKQGKVHPSPAPAHPDQYQQQCRPQLQRARRDDRGKCSDSKNSGDEACRAANIACTAALYTICILCGQRTNSCLRCCKGEVSVVKRDYPSKQLVTHCLNSCNKWAVSAALGDKLLRSPQSQLLLSYSSRSKAVEEDLVALFRSVCAADLRCLELSGHNTRPWSVHASDMADAKTMTEIFALSSQRMRFSSKDMKAAIGGVLHALLDQACSVSAATRADGSSIVEPSSSVLTAGWSEALNSTVAVDPDGANILVSGTSDALYHGVPVELKTISTKNGSSASGKIGKWLNQLAVYQCSRPQDRAAVLVVICRDTCAVKAFEVSPANVDRAERLWRGILQQDSMLTDCFALSRPYVEALHRSRLEIKGLVVTTTVGEPQRAVTSVVHRKLFLGVVAKARDLLRRHATRFLNECVIALNAHIGTDCSLACRCFLRARRCIGLLLGPQQRGHGHSRGKNRGKSKDKSHQEKGQGQGSGSVFNFPRWEIGLQHLFEGVRERLLHRATQEDQLADNYLLLEHASGGFTTAQTLRLALANAMAVYGTVLGDSDPLTLAVRKKSKVAKDQGLIIGGAVVAVVNEFDAQMDEDADSDVDNSSNTSASDKESASGSELVDDHGDDALVETDETLFSKLHADQVWSQQSDTDTDTDTDTAASVAVCNFNDDVDDMDFNSLKLEDK